MADFAACVEDGDAEQGAAEVGDDHAGLIGCGHSAPWPLPLASAPAPSL